MYFKRIMVLLLISTLLVSCSKDDDIICCYNLSAGLEFYLINEDGENLLLPETDGSYDFNEIKVFYLVDGEKKRVAYPWTLRLLDEIGPPFLGLTTSDNTDNFLSEENGIKKGIHVAYLELNQETTDTITTEWEAKEHAYFKNTRAFYNGTEVFWRDSIVK